VGQTERIYKIEQLLNDRKVVPFSVFKEALEVSAATLKRDLEHMRERLNAPIVWDREARGYRFEEAKGRGPRYQLPGLWFNASEIHALLAMEHLIENMQPGLLSSHVAPLRTRLRAMLGTADNSAEEIERRVKMIHLGARRTEIKHFEVIGSALLGRKRLAIAHFNRERGETTEREVSPQRLIHHRENWYLDAWCHKVDALRSFAVDAIQSARIGDAAAKTVAERELDEHFKAGYGIFSGSKVKWAKLRFSAERARWVSTEQWHENQKSKFDADGSYVLEIPYSDDRELMMDILKFGPDCEVLGPAELRRKVAAKLKQAFDQY
jgi:predicted DNA-binding transcriptional regulator YafY